MTLIDELALTGRHLPFPDGTIGRASDDVDFNHGNTVDVVLVTPANNNVLTDERPLEAEMIKE